LKETFPNEVGDVRGRGFFLGIEFIADKESQKPDRDLSLYIMNEL
jgi:4-aminobutyrate aminotransferase-like enzyme